MVVRAVQNRVPFLPSRRLSLNPSRTVNENSTEIIDIREGRARHQKVAEGAEEGGRIVVGEKGGRIEAERPGASGRRGVDKSPRRIVRAAAAAVGSGGGEPPAIPSLPSRESASAMHGFLRNFCTVMGRAAGTSRRRRAGARQKCQAGSARRRRTAVRPTPRPGQASRAPPPQLLRRR